MVVHLLSNSERSSLGFLKHCHLLIVQRVVMELIQAVSILMVCIIILSSGFIWNWTWHTHVQICIDPCPPNQTNRSFWKISSPLLPQLMRTLVSSSSSFSSSFWVEETASYSMVKTSVCLQYCINLQWHHEFGVNCFIRLLQASIFVSSYSHGLLHLLWALYTKLDR